MIKYFTLILLLGISFFINAQTEKDFPELSQSDLPAGNVIKTAYYDGTSLWGLIDGGADIYLEYGFDKLLFQEVEMNGLKFRCEIYKMNDEKAAFGIFSVSRYKCESSDTLTKFICITQYQVQAPVGQVYISISNETGDLKAGKQTLDLFSVYSAKINPSSIELPALFTKNSFEPYMNQLKFIKGRLGIQNGFPAWIDMFDPFDGYEAYILPVESGSGFANIAQIKFSSETDANKFIDANKTGSAGTASKTIKVLSPGQIIFIESDLPAGQPDKYLNGR